MLKIFRKYNKVILVVGGTILMVIFLLPAGLSQILGSRMAQPVGKLGGKTITAKDVQQSAREVQVVAATLGPLFNTLPIDSRDAPEHWLLLTTAAQRAGLVGGPNDGAAFLEEAARLSVDLFTQPTSPNQRDQFIASHLAGSRASRDRALQQYGMTGEQVDQALAKARGIFRMILTADPSTIWSRPEAIEIGKEINDTATVGMLLIPASALSPSVKPADEDQLAAHFDKYRSLKPADDLYGIGYLQPSAVRIEWIAIDRPALSGRLQLDPIEVNKYWRQNRTRFPGDFVDERTSVQAAYRSSQVQSILSRLEQLLQREVYKSTAQLKGSQRHRDLPPDWSTKMPDLTALARMLQGKLAQEFKLDEGDTVVSAVAGTSWMAQDDLARLTGIGPSTFTFNAQNKFPFPQYAMAVQELGGDERIGVQQGLIYGPTVANVTGSHFFFRITDVRPEGPPASLDVVRDQVVKDLAMLDAMEMLDERSELYVKRARDEGLDAVADSLELQVQWNMSVTSIEVRQNDKSLSPTLNYPAIRDAIIAAARTTNPLGSMEDHAKEAGSVVAVLVPEARGLVVSQLQKWKPLTIEAFRQSAITIAHRARREKTAGVQSEAFSLDAMAQRLGFTWLRDRDASDEDDDGSSSDAG